MAKKFSLNDLLSSVSKLVEEQPAGARKSSAREKAAQQEIENAILVLAAAVIRCDRNFSEDTEVFLLDYLVKQFGDAGKRHRLNAIHSHLETGTEPYTKIACKELKMLTTPDSRLPILKFLFGVAAADDYINAKESRCIHRIAGYLGIQESDFREIKQEYVSRNNPYYVLGIEEEASMQEVKNAYRRMVLKFHPDKRTDAVSEKESNEKFRMIQRAFEVIQQQKGKS